VHLFMSIGAPSLPIGSLTCGNTGGVLEKVGHSWPVVSTSVERLVARGSHGPCARATVGHLPAPTD
jgi:hypothetical protein